MSEQYLVLDIGGTFIKYAVMDREAQFIEQGKAPAQTASEEEMLASLAGVRSSVDAYDYEGVAISMPGRIGTAEGIAYTGGAFRWIVNYPAAERYGAVFGKPTTIANDGKCAAYAESWMGALSDVDSGAVIVLGTGVGGGIVLNHQVWMGHTGGAGELSAYPCNFDTMNQDILISGDMTPIWAGRVAASAICADYASRKGLESADGFALFNAYDQEDPAALAALDAFAYNMGAGIYGLQSVLDLPRYAIGGGISARPEVTDYVRKGVDEFFGNQSFTPFGKPEIVTCKFGNEANLIGALAFHLRQGE